MNVANDKLWARISFVLFIISFTALCLFVLTQSATKLQINPLSGKIQANESQFYFTSGIVESISEQDRQTYLTIETFCTVSGKYDTLIKPELMVEIGDFVTVTGTVETFNEKSVLKINEIS